MIFACERFCNRIIVITARVHSCCSCGNFPTARLVRVGWSQWVDATLNSNPPYIKNKSVKGGKDWGVSEAGMKQVDDNIGYVLKKLKDIGQLDNTIVVFSADKGGRGYQLSRWRRHAVQGQKGEVWEGGYRVPCVICWPGHIKPGTMYNQLFAALDWHPARAGGRLRPEEHNEHRRRTCRHADRISIRLEHAPDR
jgi:Sulfatase